MVIKLVEACLKVVEGCLDNRMNSMSVVRLRIGYEGYSRGVLMRCNNVSQYLNSIRAGRDCLNSVKCIRKYLSVHEKMCDCQMRLEGGEMDVWMNTLYAIRPCSSHLRLAMRFELVRDSSNSLRLNWTCTWSYDELNGTLPIDIQTSEHEVVVSPDCIEGCDHQ
jgi:hypothetical protein